jgi:hypothetical protein
MTRRLARDAAAACATLAVAAWAVWPGNWRIGAGVVGGGVLVGVSAWAIRGVVDGLMGAGPGGMVRTWVLVKLFTRHVILAAAAYGMMVRLRLDPVGMLVGVSSLALAAGIEAVRRLQHSS